MLGFLKRKREEGLQGIAGKIDRLEERIERAFLEIENLKRENQYTLQHLGLIRYNAFRDMGGNQSFSLAILNGKSDGVVITNLVYREGSKIFIKPIKGGKSEILLTEEERKTIELAKNGNRNKKAKSNKEATGSSNFGAC